MIHLTQLDPLPAFIRTFSVWRAQRSQVNSRARSIPFWRKRRLKSESRSTACMHAAMPSTDKGSKYARASPEISGRHEVFETIVGTPQAMASTIGNEKPSYNEGTTARL